MEPTKKNKAAPLLVVGVVAIALMIIFYLVVLFFLPDFFQNLQSGDVPPIVK